MRDHRMFDDRGASLVEFALIVPIMALLVFGIVEFGLAFSDAQNLRQAVREGTRDVTARPDDFVVPAAPPLPATFDDTKLRATIANEADLPDPSRLHINWSPSGTVMKAGDDFTICATYDLKSRTVLLSPFMDGKKLRSVVHMRFESDLDVAIPAGPDPTVPCSGTPVGPPAGATTTTTDPCGSDTTPPGGTFTLPQYTASTAVNLTMGFDASAIAMAFSVDGGGFSPYEAYAGSKTVTLTAGDGTHTVAVKVKDSCTNERTVTKTIVLDTGAPTAPTLSVPSAGGNPKCNSGANKMTVDLAWTASSDSLSGIDHYEWQSTTTSGSYGATVTSTTGTTATYSANVDVRTYFHVRAVDGAGNASTWSNEVFACP